MGIRIDEVINRRASVDVTFRGDVAKVEYYPDRFTPAMEREARAKQEQSDWTTGVVLDMLEPLLADWDFTTTRLDAEGKPVVEKDGTVAEDPLPLTRDAMERMPINLLLEILRQVTEDMRPGEQNGKNSKGGSLQRVV